jgi:hypothetical protein
MRWLESIVITNELHAVTCVYILFIDFVLVRKKFLSIIKTSRNSAYTTSVTASV